MGKFLVFLSVCLVVCGLLLYFQCNNIALFWIGKLPGDFIVRKGKVLIFFPISSALLISSITFLIFKGIFKRKKKD